MKILFVCKYNRFRSRVAEAYFKKICQKNGLTAESAGIIGGSYPLEKCQIESAKKFEINIDGKPRGLSTKLLKKIDFIVIVANDVPKKIFQFNGKYPKKVAVWNIPDVTTGKANEENIKIIRMIINKVDLFVSQINSGLIKLKEKK